MREKVSIIATFVCCVICVKFLPAIRSEQKILSLHFIKPIHSKQDALWLCIQ